MTPVADRPAQQELFEKLRGELPGAGLDWLVGMRERAMLRFSELGFPTTKLEDWRFTSVAPIAGGDFALSPRRAKDPAPEKLWDSALARPRAHRLVFLDGRYIPDLSSALPKGVLFGSMAELLKTAPDRLRHLLGRRPESQGSFAALNTALFSDGAVLVVPREARLEQPVHALFLSTASGAATMAHTRLLVSCAQGVAASLIEEHATIGEGSHFSNSACEIFLDEAASLEHLILQRVNAASYHVSSCEVRQSRASRYQAHTVSLGAALSRHDVHVLLAEEGAECSLNGVYLAGGTQHVDHHTLVDHAAAHCVTRELYKGVLDGRARAVFNGLIHVLPNAQKTDANVYNKNLLLSEHGLVNTNPEFKINANDVQCRHGATIGQISADALFYLRSRGVALEEARALLVFAFASEMIDKIPFEPVREALAAALTTRYLWGGAA